jgi:hypothetical protein
MKKIIIFVMIMCLSGCSLQIFDIDGFSVFSRFHVPENHILVQAHEGYKVDGEIYYEHVFLDGVVVENFKMYTIPIRITDNEKGTRWMVVKTLSTETLKVGE